jgi:hypothetical protein
MTAISPRPSARSVLFLCVSTFLCGCVVAGLVFVGVWRHTAGAEADARAAQESNRRQFVETQQELAAVKASLAHSRQLLVRARRQAAQSAGALTRTRAANTALIRSLGPGLQELTQAATLLGRQLTTIESELTALGNYAQHPGAAGLDPGYVAGQAAYISHAAEAAAAGATALVRHAADAQAALGTGAG